MEFIDSQPNPVLDIQQGRLRISNCEDWQRLEDSLIKTQELKSLEDHETIINSRNLRLLC